MAKEVTFDEWLETGYKQGWIGPPVCETHDGLPLSVAEDYAFEEGEDPCIHILRLYEDKIDKQQVEDAHSPSVWRASNMGLIK